MNTVPGSENASINDPARRNLRPEDAQAQETAAQMDATREEPPSTRQSPPREEPPDTRDTPPRREPAGEEKRIVGAGKPAIALGSDDAPDRSAKADLKDKASAAQGEQLAPLFAPSVASEYRARWVVVQQGFVDDPWRALQQGDELLSEVMGNLRDTFERERSALEGRDSESDRSSTELLRVALRRHRAFFERLLSF